MKSHCTLRAQKTIEQKTNKGTERKEEKEEKEAGKKKYRSVQNKASKVLHLEVCNEMIFDGLSFTKTKYF